MGKRVFFDAFSMISARKVPSFRFLIPKTGTLFSAPRLRFPRSSASIFFLGHQRHDSWPKLSRRLCVLYFIKLRQSHPKHRAPNIDRVSIDAGHLTGLCGRMICGKASTNFIDPVFTQSPIFYGHDLYSSKGDAVLAPKIIKHLDSIEADNNSRYRSNAA